MARLEVESGAVLPEQNMFERYTEKARRVIFFARYEASQYGSSSIESEHLLLGLMREDRAPGSHIESIRKEIEFHIKIRERISTSVEMRLSEEWIEFSKGEDHLITVLSFN
jgi:ATP-dependent Clp protease ATP-binding subunit ClpC